MHDRREDHAEPSAVRDDAWTFLSCCGGRVKTIRGAQLAERLIKQDGIKYMLGPYSSGLTKAIAPVIEKHKIPI